MGFLNNSTVTVDAILTKKGRELLARGDGSFQITQFALADDEMDYTLYNPAHPSGSAYYGEALERLPLLEAFSDDTQAMKYKLITLPRGTAKLPVLGIGQASITLKQGETKRISPETLNYLGNTVINEAGGYTAIIADARVLSLFNGEGIDSAEANALNAIETLGTNVSRTVVGTEIVLKGTTVNTLFGTNTQIQTTITFVGRDSGARLTVPVTITKS